jgi:regulator of protease activity HflC (stomatin/prohibitin superfamily)
LHLLIIWFSALLIKCFLIRRLLVDLHGGYKRARSFDAPYQHGEHMDNQQPTMKKRTLHKKLARGGALALGLAALGTYSCGSVYIAPGNQGIKQVRQAIFPWQQAGTINEVLNEGKHFRIPGLEVIHSLPRDVQVISLNGDGSKEVQKTEPYSTVMPTAHLETSDGFYVDADISIMYRITDPYKTITSLGAGDLYLNQIREKVPAVLKATFGQLQPELFYDVERRSSVDHDAREMLNRDLAQYGITVDAVMLQYPTLHDDIQGRIEQAVVNDQMVRTEASMKNEAIAQATLDSIAGLGKADSAVRIQQGTAFETRRLAERDNYKRIRGSEGQRILQLAEAERTRLINQAYEGAGSELLVCMQMAENLKGLPYILWQEGGTNPFDLEKVVRLCGGRP